MGSSPDELRREFKKSLDVFLEVWRGSKEIKPRKHFSGQIQNLRFRPNSMRG